MSDNKKNIRIVQLSNYARPEIREEANQEWIDYGEDNNYFQYIIDRFYGSPTNNAIINSLVDLTYGKGLTATDAKNNADDWLKVVKMLSPDCLRQIIQDYIVTENFTIEVHQKNGIPVKAYHAPVNCFRAEKCDKEGKVKGYYYSNNWLDVNNVEDAEYFENFEHSKSNVTILWGKKSSIGSYYYSPCSYQGALQYAELEEEVANYHNNNIKNGLSPSMLINFNNGVPTPEEQDQIEGMVLEKYSGSSNAGRAIVAFNDSQETAATIEPVQLSDADKQYEFLSKECRDKIIVGHRVVSPLLVGVREGGNGLGSNTDELKTSFQLLDNTVIRPKQELIIHFLNKILNRAGISFDLIFETLTPIDFGIDKEQEEVRDEETELCSHVNLSAEDKVIDKFISSELIACGEDESDLLEGYELYAEDEVDYEREEELDKAVEGLNKEFAEKSKSKLSKWFDFARTGTAFPNAKSEQDKVIDDTQFKVRYEYSPDRVSSDSREFCRKMVQAKKIYRKEDITRMTDKVVNAGFGERGSDTYSIWLYKGGPRCGHRWLRKTYIKKGTEGSIDVKSPNAKTISTNKAEREGLRIRNEKEVSMKPNDMPRKGFSPNNPNLPKDAR